MENQDYKFFLNETIQVNLLSFIVSLIAVAVLSALIQIFYLKFSTSLSNRYDFSKNFVVLGIATCIVIMIVKNSLALSLGLVGALSIVRFRAAIKEPEELVFLFLIIAAGLGAGSGQIKITVVGVVFSLFIIFVYSKLFNKSRLENLETINISISKDDFIQDNQIEKMIDNLKNLSDQIEFVSMSRKKISTNINLEIKVKDFKKLIQITSKIEKEIKNSKVIVARSNDLAL